MKLLIIRPQPGNDASASRVRDAGFDPIQLPFFEVRPRVWQASDPAQFDALLITSANAVRLAGAGLSAYRGLPVHSVGQNTADAVAASGLKLASVGQHGVKEALRAADSAGHHRLLWLAGEDQTDFDAPPSMQIETQITYASEPVELPVDTTDIIAGVDIVVLHSARAARRFAEFVDSSRLSREDIMVAAFSNAIAEAAEAGWRGIAIAERPDDQALLSAAHTLVKQGA